MSEQEPPGQEGAPTSPDSLVVPEPFASASILGAQPPLLLSDNASGPWEPFLPQPRPDTFPRTALAVTTLAAVGLSLALMLQSFHLKYSPRSDFMFRNVLGAEPRKVLLLSMGVSALFVLLVCGVLWLWKRERMAAALCTVATVLSPLCLAFSWPSFFIWQIGWDHPTWYLVLLTAFVFASRTLFTRSLRTVAELSRPQWLRLPAVLTKLRLPSAWAISVVAAAALAYTAYFGHFTVLRHRLIQSTAFDLGIYDNLMFNTMHGRFFKSPVLFGPGKFSYIAGHAEYVMVLFAPLYAIKPGSETLLWMQAALLGGAAIPLFMFARQFLTRGPALVISLAYLMFAPLHGPNFYDFHWLPTAIFFYFWLFYAIASRKTWLSVLMLLVLFATREDIAVGLTMLGVFLFVTGARVRFGLVLSAVAATWFGINKFIIMPHAGAWWFESMYSELFADGKSSYGSVILTLMSNPVFALTTFIRENKLAYGFHMVAPLAFLPLRKPAFVLLLIPGAFFTLLTTAYWPTVSIAFQYTSHWIPYLFLAVVLSLWLFKFEADGKAKFYAAMITLVFAVLAHSYNFGAILQREGVVGGFSRVQFTMSDAELKRYQAMMKAIALIPKEASVAAGEYMNPHISARKEAYVFRYDVGPVDYIFISRNEMSSDLRRTLNDKFQKERYGLVAYTGDEFYLFKRNLSSPTTASALQRLGLNPSSH
ncbi:MAG TPA: DUF2079 domain-containing protein [Polyangiaceae bacterium]|jgi:uncharacterized membrane protein|nr:DUF2079 domain-containing protein [Polyangiaceae bacterium]